MMPSSYMHSTVNKVTKLFPTGESHRRLPQAILIGARKGGTRALIEMLESHPDVVRAQREIHYFDRDENYSKGLQWYLHRMPFSTPGQITMEKTPAYFVTQGVPRRLYLYPKDVKILLTVRDPVIRAISDFAHIDAHRVIDHQPRNTFEEEVLRPNGELNTNRSPISNSTYDVHMKRWLEYFSLEQIHIVNGDSLIQDPFSELQKVERFLEISSFFQKDMFFFDEKKGFFCWNRLNEKAGEVKCCLGQAKGRKHPDVSEHTIIKLREFFRPHNERFYKLVHQNFGW